MKRFFASLAPLAGGVLLLLTSCGGSSDAPPTTPPVLEQPATSIEISFSSSLVIVGFPASIAVVVRDAAGRELTGRTVRWVSRDTSIAVVSAVGVIGGKRVGIVDVTASVENLQSAPLRLYVARGVPSRIEVIAPQPLVGTVGTVVTPAVAIRVVDANASVVPGVPVVITTASGAGTTENVETRSDSGGVVRVGKWTLGTRSGPQRLDVASGSLTAAIVATAAPAAPASVRVTRGAAQEGTLGRVLADSLEITVTDAYQNAVPNARVRFVTEEGHGTVSPAIATTNASGQARAAWTLSNRVGTMDASIVVESLPPVLVRATSFGFRAKSMAVGSETTCALDLADHAWCWGLATSGQIGPATTANEVPRPTLVSATLAFTKLAVSAASTCGLALGGRVWCWGSNEYGQLGDGSAADHRLPALIASDATFADIISVYLTTCGLTRDGAVLCWGLSGYGEIGVPISYVTRTPARVPLPSPATQVVASNNAFCARTATLEIYCWGDHLVTVRGALSRQPITPPALVATPDPIEDLRGWCGLTAEKLGRCLGVGIHSGTSLISWSNEIPALVAGPLNDISASHFFGCAITSAQRLLCWGDNENGRLGTGDTLRRALPVEIGADKFVARSVVQGDNQTCAVDTQRQVWCWGLNRHGGAGIAPLGKVLTPTVVAP